MKEKFAQNMEVPVSLMEFLLQTQGSFGEFFCLNFCILQCFLGEQDFQSSFILFLGDKIRNSNVFLRMCFRMCFRECISVNVFLICFQFTNPPTPLNSQNLLNVKKLFGGCSLKDNSLFTPYQNIMTGSYNDFFVRSIHDFSFGSAIWNSLPNEMRNSQSLPVFQSKIIVWIPDSCTSCVLCREYIEVVGFI